MTRSQADREFDWSTGREIERKDAEIARLRAALDQIKKLKSEPIGDTGFAVGPLSLFNAAQRIAREALKVNKVQQTPGA